MLYQSLVCFIFSATISPNASPTAYPVPRGFRGLILIFFFSFSNVSMAADQKLVNTLKKAFEQIEDWLLKLATPAAAVAVRNWCVYEEV